MQEILDNHQVMRRSGVGGHHHNGVAEKAIKDVTRMSRTMMIHQALRWPEISDKELWPLAFQHTVYMGNHLPKMEHGWSPEELWTGSKSSRSELKNARPWGCPCYVLSPKLQDGAKIPKWNPRA